ncbi:MAG: hypothetical protein LBC82_04670 [Oscillospiraceae bacterium]|jgi:hypothetical protein|nr:hypothetical protein [Oscillospiraceae bacterium]
MSTNYDKREILKLKQGLIEDSDIIKREEPEKIELRGKKKIENFFYHYKIHVIIVLFFGLLISFFTVEILMKKRSDVNFMLLATNEETSVFVFVYTDDIGEAVEKFTPHFNGNRYVYAESFPIDLFNTMNAEGVIAGQTKLFGEIRVGTTRMIMGNRDAFDRIIGDDLTVGDVYVNLSRLYPGNENIVEDVFFRVRGSELSRLADMDEHCPDDFYIAVIEMNLHNSGQQRAHERSLIVLDNIINGAVIN